ncbi:GL22954 [Drosophila persimilis]|uniref:GL22954 n=1 Tax=Drosophila persimilis TaxID=7234 RepID=B4H9T9_DROPE|nr:GL22954 [Drosophila persimilis]
MYRCSKIDNICNLDSYPILARGPQTSNPQYSRSDVDLIESELSLTIEMEMEQDQQQLIVDKDATSLISIKRNSSGNSAWKKDFVLSERHLEDEPVKLTQKVWQRDIRPPLGMWLVGDMERLQEHLDENLLGVDAKWMLFTSAVMSGRCITMLKQCPPFNRPFSRSQIEALRVATIRMPVMTTVQRSVYQDLLFLTAEPATEPEPEPHISLLHWLLLKSKTPHLQHVPLSKLDSLWEQIGQNPGCRPDHFFRVEMPFALSVPDLVRPCVFYSGPIDVLHSLIAGPIDLNSKYLELHDSLIKATFVSTVCACWENSLCGSTLRTVAICEKRSSMVQVRYLLMFRGTELEMSLPRELRLETVDVVVTSLSPQKSDKMNMWTNMLCKALMEEGPMFGIVTAALRDVCGFIRKHYSCNKH